MKRKIDSAFFRYIFIVVFFLFAFILSKHIGFTQATTSISNLTKLNLPFGVDFNEKEISFINSLSPIELEKLIQIVKLIIERNNAVQIKPTFPTPTSGQFNNSDDIQNEDEQSNLFINNSPYSEQITGSQNSFEEPQIPLKEFLGILNQNPSNQELSNIPINPACRQNYGVVHPGGSTCPFNIEDTTNTVKRTAMQICSVLGRPLVVNSAYRSPECNKRVSSSGSDGPHTTGAALDISQNGLTSEEKVKIFGIFKLNGFSGIGCYGPGKHVHFDHLNPRRWGSGCPIELRAAGY